MRKSKRSKANKHSRARNTTVADKMVEPGKRLLNEAMPIDMPIEERSVEKIGKAVETEAGLASKMAEPRIVVPLIAKAGSPFQMYAENLEEGIPILADKIYPLGQVSASGVTTVTLRVPGERTIDVKVGESWITSRITIQKTSMGDSD